MCNDILQAHDEALNESHHGHPTIVEVVHTGQPGRPAIVVILIFFTGPIHCIQHRASVDFLVLAGKLSVMLFIFATM